MNSRERVLTAFEHKQPDRVPCWCGASEEFWAKARNQLGLDDEGLRKHFRDGFRRVHAKYVGPELSLFRSCQEPNGFRHRMPTYLNAVKLIVRKTPLGHYKG